MGNTRSCHRVFALLGQVDRAALVRCATQISHQYIGCHDTDMFAVNIDLMQLLIRRLNEIEPPEVQKAVVMEFEKQPNDTNLHCR